MNSVVHRERATPSLLITLVLLCFVLLPQAHAVVPAPDGGYPGGNTAEGQNALLSLTSGTYNTAVGLFSLLSNSTGKFNTGVGAGTLLSNTGDANTATGAGALLSNISGTDNTADGVFALFSNTASGNTAIGSNALLNNTTGGTLENIQGIDIGPNVAVGWEALESNTVASANTAVGFQALHSFTTGPMGFEQVGLCTAVGFQALANATGNGIGNSGFGYQALHNNSDGGANTAIGLSALAANTTGDGNVAAGANALLNNTIGAGNTANGSNALTSNTDGIHNTAIGLNALDANTSGSSNAALGEFSGGSVTTANNVICIGANVFGENADNSCYIGNIFNQTSASGIQVFVNSNNKLGTVTSSKRFKEEIKPMGKVSEALLALQPVTFRYKKELDPAGTSQFGLVAEEVEKVNPDLVVHDKDGKPYSVRYDQVNAMLLNEFLKEHRKVKELTSTVAKQDATIVQQQKDFQAAITRQENEIHELTASLKEQAVQIQKVSARVELSKSATKLADDSR